MNNIKFILHIFICLSLLIGTQTNAISSSEYLTKPDWYKNLYNSFLSAEIKADAELRKTMVINGLTEAEWLKKRAHTINAVQRVVSTDNATTVPYRMSMKPEDQAVKSLVPDILETALTWQAQILFSLGRITLDGVKYFISESDPILNSKTSSIILEPKLTPAGIRVFKSISNSTNYSQNSSDSNISNAINKGAYIARNFNCLATDKCSLFPSITALPNGYPFSMPVLLISNSIYNNYYVVGDSFNIYNVAKDNYLTAYFKDYQSIISYINSIPPCSFGSVSVLGDRGIPIQTIGPVCSISFYLNLNADYNAISPTFTFELPRSLNYGFFITNSSYPFYFSNITYMPSFSSNVQVGFSAKNWVASSGFSISIDSSQLDAYSNNIQSMRFTKSELDSKVPKSLIAAHLNNLLKRASQLSDYQGLPYDVTNPILESQISDRGLTLRDLLGSTTAENGEVYISPDGKTQDPLVIQYVINNNCTGTNSCNNNGGDVDLTSPPAVEPKLEPTPTAISILQPLLDLLPNYKITTISHVPGVCPTVTFDTQFGDPGGAYYRSWLIDHHCTMFEDFRSMISSIFMVLFAFASFRIVMKA